MGFVNGLLRALMADAARAARNAQFIERFNERWNRLTGIHDLMVKQFVVPLRAVREEMKESEIQKLNECLSEMNYWRNEIHCNINAASLAQLSRYATTIKNTAMKAIKLCQKYAVHSDLKSVAYHSTRKMLVINGEDFYFFG